MESGVTILLKCPEKVATSGTYFVTPAKLRIIPRIKAIKTGFNTAFLILIKRLSPEIRYTPNVNIKTLVMMFKTIK